MQAFFFHIGHGKTGSSYLQSCLALSQDELRAHGIYYPLSGKGAVKALAGHINMGNFPVLKGHKFHADGQYAGIVRQAMEDAPEADALLLSNETLYKSIDRGSFLDQIAILPTYADKHFLLFIRNPLDHALSAFQQQLKSNKVNSIEETLQTYALPKRVPEVLEAIKATGCSLKVVNYSRCKLNIVSVLARWLGVPESSFTRPTEKTVNRSLTRTEMELQRAFNKYVGRRARLFVADALSNEVPDLRSEQPFITRDALAAFLKRMAPMVERANTVLPECARYHLPTLDEALLTLPEEKDKDTFALNAAQIDTLARNMARYFRLHPMSERPSRDQRLSQGRG